MININIIDWFNSYRGLHTYVLIQQECPPSRVWIAVCRKCIINLCKERKTMEEMKEKIKQVINE
jgi:hypothetical protein